MYKKIKKCLTACSSDQRTMKTHTYRYTHTHMYSMYLLMFCGLEAVITLLTPLSGLCRLANYFNFRSSSLLFDLSAAASSHSPPPLFLSPPLSPPLSRSFLPPSFHQSDSTALRLICSLPKMHVFFVSAINVRPSRWHRLCPVYGLCLVGGGSSRSHI